MSWLAVTALFAALAAWGSRGAGAFYSQLELPGWAPAGWLFAPVWTVLYLMMAAAAWLAARRAGVTVGHGLFVAQLGLNALWTWLFFVWRQGGVAFLEILVLIAVAGATAAAFYRIRPLAGWLFVPYLAWLGYAAALSYAAWRAEEVEVPLRQP